MSLYKQLTLEEFNNIIESLKKNFIEEQKKEKNSFQIIPLNIASYNTFQERLLECLSTFPKTIKTPDTLSVI